MNRDRQRRMEAGLKARMKAVAVRRQCPKCDRKQALTKVRKIHPAEPQIYVCRYCGHEFARGNETMTVRQINARWQDEPLPEVAVIPRIEQFQGCLLGCALGDIVGAWAEKRPSDEARDFAERSVREYDFSKVGKHHGGSSFGQYTDDTQLSRELMLSLVDEGGWTPEDFAERIARIFARDGVVGFGGATLEAAKKLQEGVPWNEAGTPPPRAGNGAAMRAAPMGLFFWSDTDRLIEATKEQAIITHTAPMSVAAAVAVAVATAMCLNASKQTSAPHELGWWRWLARFVKRVNEDYAADIDHLADMVFKGRKGKDPRKPGGDAERREVAQWVLKEDDGRWSGVSPYARTSVLWSLYCLMAHPTDPWKAIELAVWVGGDSDTIGAMAGAMAGAHVGVDRFPDRAMQEVAPLIHDAKAEDYDWNGLDRIVHYLYAVAVRRYNEALEEQAAAVGREWDEICARVPEDEVEDAKKQRQKRVKHVLSFKAEAPPYVRTVSASRAPEEPDEEPDGGASILDVLGGE